MTPPRGALNRRPTGPHTTPRPTAHRPAATETKD